MRTKASAQISAHIYRFARALEVVVAVVAVLESLPSHRKAGQPPDVYRPKYSKASGWDQSIWKPKKWKRWKLSSNRP